MRLRMRLRAHIHLTVHEKGSIFPAIYDCSNFQHWKLGTKKFLCFLLTHFHQLILREGIFGTTAS